MGGKATREHRERWKRDNPDKLREGRKRYKQKPEVKAKNRAAVQKYRDQLGGHTLLVRSARARAKKRELAFNLPEDWKSDVTACEWCGLPFEKGSRMFAASIDRIDDTKGYTEDNCRLILMGLNVFKNKFTDADVLKVVRALVNRVGG